jgi:hypothetical protein
MSDKRTNRKSALLPRLAPKFELTVFECNGLSKTTSKGGNECNGEIYQPLRSNPVCLNHCSAAVCLTSIHPWRQSRL